MKIFIFRKSMAIQILMLSPYIFPPLGIAIFSTFYLDVGQYGKA
ncbi:hypothetical protein [Peribacillus simplex]